MKQTWRWFGPPDRTSINDILQAGAEGIVSALHHIAPGVVWTVEEIDKRIEEIGHMDDGEPSGLHWDVVESLPVSEDIKKQAGDWREHIENYKISLRNLAQRNIEVICYNFMPVLDWTRTDLKYRMSHGGTTMRFDLIDFAAFDIHLLQRDGAVEAFSSEIAEHAGRRFNLMSEQKKHEISNNVACGLPGSTESLTLEDIRQHLAEYNNISSDQLRRHFIDFLSEVAPVAEELGMRLCCHPDDPPFPLLGLPRIMSTEEDYKTIIQAVDMPANGITLCAGSLGARPDNDLPGMVDRLGDRLHFVHLRNVKRETQGIPASFHEAEHLAGDTDMVALTKAVLQEEKRRREMGRKDWSIPIRPDHGMDILDDLKRSGQPGYPSIGRLKGLAELRGLITALSSLEDKGNR
ncbi:mannonate dehydratase [Desulfogranum japonicum]|uniref:mannonate dehydratase n=1 Tax=Desulfogranum japonicum TaxID=231447 RepID=UPI0004207E64|nr:mannonate dehydratase [Desulfogranum japonicum]